MKKAELEERLINFAVLIIEISQEIENTKAGVHLAGQIIRCGSSPSLNYAEAQSTESRKDFVHKIKIVLKELRETMVCLKILLRTRLIKSSEKLENALRENDELISIFVKSVETARRNLRNPS